MPSWHTLPKKVEFSCNSYSTDSFIQVQRADYGIFLSISYSPYWAAKLFFLTKILAFDLCPLNIDNAKFPPPYLSFVSFSVANWKNPLRRQAKVSPRKGIFWNLLIPTTWVHYLSNGYKEFGLLIFEYEARGALEKSKNLFFYSTPRGMRRNSYTYI